MFKKITVAVLLPTYNSEKYIKEQLDSILNQVDINVKIYISDDGSTDNTLKIVKQYDSKTSMKLKSQAKLITFVTLCNLLESQGACNLVKIVSTSYLIKVIPSKH